MAANTKMTVPNVAVEREQLFALVEVRRMMTMDDELVVVVHRIVMDEAASTTMMDDEQVLVDHKIVMVHWTNANVRANDRASVRSIVGVNASVSVTVDHTKTMESMVVDHMKKMVLTRTIAVEEHMIVMVDHMIAMEC